MMSWHRFRYFFTIATCLLLLSFGYQNCSKTNFQSKSQGVSVPDDVVKNGCNESDGCDSSDSDDSSGKDFVTPNDPNSDDDSLPPHEGLRVPAQVSVGEDSGKAIINYEFDSPSNSARRFNVVVKGDDAKEGEDFDPNFKSMITVPAGETSFSVAVDIINDDLWDVTNESFYIKLQDSKNSTATKVTIIDDETFPSISLKKTVYNNPDTMTPNSLVFSAAADQDLTVSLRSDENEAEANQNVCGINLSDARIALPGVHYSPLAVTEVTLKAYEFESSEFITRWLDAPDKSKLSVCYHLLEIW